METAPAGLTESLHTARTEMTNASIFEKIDDCDELDGLCKGGPAKMVRKIYQTAKHHMEMLDNFWDLVAQGMTRVAKYQEIKDTVAWSGATCTSLSPLAWPFKQFLAR